MKTLPAIHPEGSAVAPPETCNAWLVSTASLISLVVPCRNEAAHLDLFMRSILSQQLPAGFALEILIAEGRSSDGTRERLRAYETNYPQVRVLDNPERIVSAGLNRAIREARGQFIVRMDVHAEYAPDYVVRCIKTLEDSKAENVGGPARTRCDGYLQQANCLAYRSVFSCGGPKFHDPDYQGKVDTVTFGCWRKTTLERIGLFDERLVRNQDDELNLRIIRSGGTVWQDPSIRAWYRPRSSLRSLFRQYYEYGYWKVFVIRKHRVPASVRQLVPPLFVLILLLLSALSFVSRIATGLLVLVSIAYLAAALFASVQAAHRAGQWKLLPALPVIFATYHFAYGTGFLKALLQGPFLHGRTQWAERSARGPLRTDSLRILPDSINSTPHND